MMTTKTAASLALVALMASLTSSTSAEPLPNGLRGTWKITRVLPTTNAACWNKEQAMPLVGSTITYRADSMTWRGGVVPVEGITTRDVSAEQFRKENGGETPAEFAQLGIRAKSVTEVDFQHQDQDITGATTEVPGDSVLIVSPTRIVVSACGVYYEATRSGSIMVRTSGSMRQAAGR
jgi:hypothetical protein